MTDKYEIAAKVALASLDNWSGRMTAKIQREIFGRNIFGRKQITIDATGQGRVFGTFSVCFGTDSAFFDYSFSQIAELANDSQAIPGF